jgi:hypothetical protein
MKKQTLILTLLGMAQALALACGLILGLTPLASASEPASPAAIPARLVIRGIELDSPITPVSLNLIEVRAKLTVSGRWRKRQWAGIICQPD